MKNLVKTYRYLLEDVEVNVLVGAVQALQYDTMLIHIEAVIHNTVMIQNLKKAIEEQFDNATIVLVKISREEKSALSVYGFDDGVDESSLNELICELNKERLGHLHEIKMCRQGLINRYFTDPLTNLPNLYKLRNDLHDKQGSFIIIHVDNFKLINDFYGFVAGDYILEQSASHMNAMLNDGTLYRMSSDEFAFVLNEKLEFYALKSYIGALFSNLKNLSFTYQETEIYLDFTLASSAGSSWSDIFSKVSMSLQYAKENHLPFWIYEDRMHFESAYEQNLEISTVIRKAVESSGIIPYFQPIICNKTGTIEKYECLSRLIDAKGELLSPNLFIPISKKIKVYHLVTQEIINKSFEVFKESELSFTINLSIEDIMSHKIYNFIIEKLAASHMGERVIFELLESESIHDFKKVTQFINEVKRYGAKIAIDDFGSGFSNFSYLTKLDIDFIKIDGSLIENVDSDRNAELVVKTIVEFAHHLKIKTIAEFVHSSTVLSKVKSLGVDYSQGYYIDKPHPVI